MNDNIKCFFENFGKLNLVEIRRCKNVHYGLVECEKVENANAVLSNELCRVGDCNFQVFMPEKYRHSHSFLLHFGLKPEIGSAVNFPRLNAQDPTVYLTNYNIPIRTLYIEPIKDNVSITFCNFLYKSL